MDLLLPSGRCGRHTRAPSPTVSIPSRSFYHPPTAGIIDVLPRVLIDMDVHAYCENIRFFYQACPCARTPTRPHRCPCRNHNHILLARCPYSATAGQRRVPWRATHGRPPPHDRISRRAYTSRACATLLGRPTPRKGGATAGAPCPTRGRVRSLSSGTVHVYADGCGPPAVALAEPPPARGELRAGARGLANVRLWSSWRGRGCAGGGLTTEESAQAGVHLGDGARRVLREKRGQGQVEEGEGSRS